LPGIETLVKAINEKLKGFGISHSTFERMLRKAKELGILSIETQQNLKVEKDIWKA
jgi:DNA-binding transcriptional regulator LsrR (DeoR family)